MRIVTALAAALMAVGQPAFAACDLSPLEITELDDLAARYGLPMNSVRKLRFEFPTSRASFQGRSETHATVTELTTFNVAPIVAEMTRDFRRGLPTDKCKLIFDPPSLATTRKSETSLGVVASGRARLRACVRYSYPKCNHLKCRKAYSVSSATIAEGRFTKHLEFVVQPSADGQKLNWKVYGSAADADVDLKFFRPAFDVLLKAALERVLEHHASNEIDQMSSNHVGQFLRGKLINLEPALNIEDAYAEFRFKQARFESHELLTTRRETTPRRISVACKIRDSLLQMNATAESIANPRRTYEVVPGDSVWRVAQKLYGDGRYFVLLIRQNESLQQSTTLKPGQVLNAIPMYEIQDANEGLIQGGDTLWDLVKSQGGDVDEGIRRIAEQNGIADPSKILPLQRIVLPSADAPVP